MTALVHSSDAISAFLAGCAPSDILDQSLNLYQGNFTPNYWGPRMACWAQVMEGHLAELGPASAVIRSSAQGLAAYALAAAPQNATAAAALASTMTATADAIDSLGKRMVRAIGAIKDAGLVAYWLPSGISDADAEKIDTDAAGVVNDDVLPIVDSFMSALEALPALQIAATQINVNDAAGLAQTQQQVQHLLQLLDDSGPSFFEALMEQLFGLNWAPKLALTVIGGFGVVAGGYYLIRRAKGK